MSEVPRVLKCPRRKKWTFKRVTPRELLNLTCVSIEFIKTLYNMNLLESSIVNELSEVWSFY